MNRKSFVSASVAGLSAAALIPAAALPQGTGRIDVHHHFAENAAFWSRWSVEHLRPIIRGVSDALSRSRFPMFKAMFPDGFLPEARRFYYDTAQVANVVPMSALAKMVPLSHILFGSDYPFLTLKENIDGLNGCGVFDAPQLSAINRNNVVALLGTSR